MGIFLFVWGLLMLALGIYLFRYGADRIWEGMCYPVFSLALVQLGQGSYSIWQAYKKQRSLKTNNYSKQIAQEQTDVQRLQKSLRQRTAIQQTLLVIALGLTLAGIFLGTRKPFMVGSGLGLLVQTAIIYIIDILTLWRTDLYASELSIESNN